jgi:hypothetical protein
MTYEEFMTLYGKAHRLSYTRVWTQEDLDEALKLHALYLKYRTDTNLPYNIDHLRFGGYGRYSGSNHVGIGIQRMNNLDFRRADMTDAMTFFVQFDGSNLAGVTNLKVFTNISKRNRFHCVKIDKTTLVTIQYPPHTYE